jgi:uncharacterized membrane protein
MMPIIGLLVGAVVGLWLGHNFDALLGGAFVGLIAGLLVHALQKRSVKPASSAVDVDATRFAALEERVARVEAALERAGLARAAQTIAPQAASALSSAPSADIAAERAPMAQTPLPPTTATPTTSIAAASAIPPAPAYGARAAAQPNRIWTWITGGNTLARVGIIVLFIGVGFLLKYAAEHVTVPIELRVAGVALGGVALLLLGWRLRERRTAYAMILQGGGVGVLYLTVFAALKLYALLPPGAAFALLFVIAALSSWLAVRQDAIALAAVGVVGGFFAPILTSSGSGNHVVLFSYYALLNAGIFFIAWFKAWRLLNLLGFACTFIIGTLWGVTRYRQVDFATTEPFLIVFFLFYVGIAVLYALKRSVEVKHYVDGTIVFGTPLVAAGLQQGLVHQYEFGMAASAVAASALYLLLARFLWGRRREDLRLLVESFLALGVVFATLAVPLAFDARWTSATWALEGAAIVWIGARQDRLAARVFGLVLQLAAGVAFGMGSIQLIDHTTANARLLLNSEFVGAALIAAAGLLSAWIIDGNPDRLRRWESAIAPVVFAWGAIWWLVAGGREIDRFVRADVQLAFAVAFLSVTGLAFAYAARKLRWRFAWVAARLLLPLLLLCALGGITHAANVGGHLFANGGVFAWAFAVLASFELLRMFDRDAAPAGESGATSAGHAGFVVLVTLLAAHEIGWLAREFVGGGSVWSVVPWGLAPALALILICKLSPRESWPFATHRRAYLVVAAFLLVAWALIFALLVNLVHDGNPAPLPFVPLINPLDLTLGLIVGSLALWTLRLAREDIDIRAWLPRELLYGVPAALIFIWANAIVMRTIHHWYGVPWAFDAMWHSTLVQAALSLLWSVIALAVMVFANRRAARVGWVAGATLLAIVVVKLFVVDLSRIGGIERIVSFIGVGLLLLLIGYLAPVPPRRKEEMS